MSTHQQLANKLIDGKSQKEHALTEFRNKLLPITIANAISRSKFYSDFYRNSIRHVQSVQDLQGLPILTKELVIDNFGDLIVGKELPALIQHTTGTTGTPLPIYRSQEEINFITNFFSSLIDNSDTRLIPLVLHLSDLYHGPSLQIPAQEYSLPVGITDDVLLSQAAHLLTEEQNIPGVEKKVSVIVGLVPYVKTLTNYLLETGFDFSNTDIKTIVPLCTIITPRWRKILTSVWNANVVDRYSLSEIFGGATYCLKCKNYHFDAFVIPEVVDPFSSRPISSGVGILVLTSLYPFVQKQPMIRYWTGDLVEISQDSCQKDLSVRFKGRMSNACYIENDNIKEIVILPVDLYETLDQIPDIGFSERLTDISIIRDHSSAGSLKFKLEKRKIKQKTRIKLKIELRYSPKLYLKRVSYLHRQIRTKLFRKSPTLRDYVNRGLVCFEIEFTGPGTISSLPLKV